METGSISTASATRQSEACGDFLAAREYPRIGGRLRFGMVAETARSFRSLFQGRDDVFPLRWQNPKTGKAGYAPACHNEWIRGICEKPRIKCSNCPSQAFVPVSDEVIRSHLQGRNVAEPGKTEPFVAGVYPERRFARYRIRPQLNRYRTRSSMMGYVELI